MAASSSWASPHPNHRAHISSVYTAAVCSVCCMCRALVWHNVERKPFTFLRLKHFIFFFFFYFFFLLYFGRVCRAPHHILYLCHQEQHRKLADYYEVSTCLSRWPIEVAGLQICFNTTCKSVHIYRFAECAVALYSYSKWIYNENNRIVISIIAPNKMG